MSLNRKTLVVFSFLIVGSTMIFNYLDHGNLFNFNKSHQKIRINKSSPNSPFSKKANSGMNIALDFKQLSGTDHYLLSAKAMTNINSESEISYNWQLPENVFVNAGDISGTIPNGGTVELDVNIDFEKSYQDIHFQASMKYGDTVIGNVNNFFLTDQVDPDEAEAKRKFMNQQLQNGKPKIFQ